MRLEQVGDFGSRGGRQREGLRVGPERLMDLEMPVLDRWEVVRRLKKDAQTGHIPIIDMSAYALDSEREKAIASGCDEFDAPIEFEALVATIGRLVANPYIR
jgi:CheY-like chemotaxis protein